MTTVIAIVIAIEYARREVKILLCEGGKLLDGILSRTESGIFFADLSFDDTPSPFFISKGRRFCETVDEQRPA
ncbi:unnamed protein product [Cochlearia groenlandica]